MDLNGKKAAAACFIIFIRTFSKKKHKLDKNINMHHVLIFHYGTDNMYEIRRMQDPHSITYFYYFYD